MRNKETDKFTWESAEEKIRRWIKISAAKKLKALREMNEFLDRALTKREKLIRRRLRESRH